MRGKWIEFKLVVNYVFHDNCVQRYYGQMVSLNFFKQISHMCEEVSIYVWSLLGLSKIKGTKSQNNNIYVDKYPDYCVRPRQLS